MYFPKTLLSLKKKKLVNTIALTPAINLQNKFLKNQSTDDLG